MQIIIMNKKFVKFQFKKKPLALLERRCHVKIVQTRVMPFKTYPLAKLKQYKTMYLSENIVAQRGVN